MLHVLNGDASAAVFAEAGVPGDRLIWRDILVEGPVTAGEAGAEVLAARAAWLGERLGIEPASYVSAVQEQAAALATARHHDEVVLWFEQDLFCAVNLWAILDRLSAEAPEVRLGLVYPATDEVRGLGARSARALAELFAGRRPVTEAMRAHGRRAWRAYASADPADSAQLIEGDEPLPFVRDAFRCHLGRFPAVGNGLSEIETTTLAILRRGPRRFVDLFREVSAHPRIRRHGMGDVQFAACVRGLGRLVSVTGQETTTADIEITQRGRDVAAGDLDRLALGALDIWLGGVHLRPGAPLWRWDSARGRLVPWPA